MLGTGTHRVARPRQAELRDDLLSRDYVEFLELLHFLVIPTKNDVLLPASTIAFKLVELGLCIVSFDEALWALSGCFRGGVQRGEKARR